jgi:hypothetical protein
VSRPHGNSSGLITDRSDRYRPGNLLVGGGGRGVRVASEEHGVGDWIVIRDEGNLVGEVLMKRSAWEKMDLKKREEVIGRESRRDSKNEKQSF